MMKKSAERTELHSQADINYDVGTVTTIRVTRRGEGRNLRVGGRDLGAEKV